MLRAREGLGSNPRTKHIKGKLETYKEDRIHVCRKTFVHTDTLLLR